MREGEITISQCKQCGECCRNREIRITPDEARAISEHLRKPIDDFSSVVGPVLQLKQVDERCIFLENNKCKIHAVKPFQCKTYPIIYHHLALSSEVFKGLQVDYLVFSCKNGHTKIIRFSDFMQQTEERLRYLRSVYGEENDCKDDSN